MSQPSQFVAAISTKDLLIDIMLGAGLNTSGLHTENGLICSDSCQKGIWAEGFPIAPALRYTTDIDIWTKGNVDAFADMFLSHCSATGAE